MPAEPVAAEEVKKEEPPNPIDEKKDDKDE